MTSAPELSSKRARSPLAAPPLATARYRRYFWELESLPGGWVRQQTTPLSTAHYAGRDSILDMAGVRGADKRGEGVTIAGREAWGKKGIAARSQGTSQ